MQHGTFRIKIQSGMSQYALSLHGYVDISWSDTSYDLANGPGFWKLLLSKNIADIHV